MTPSTTPGPPPCPSPVRSRRRPGRTLAVGVRAAWLVVILASAGSVQAQQTAPALPEDWLQGYARTVGGEWLMYPWAYPGQTRSLLSRATDGRMTVEWEGEAAPAGAPDDLVTYLWHGGTASGYGGHRFTLSVNGTAVVTFTSGRTRDDRTWSVTGDRGATLSFRTTRVGQFDELFGFMWLTAPRRVFGPGPPRFAVTGEAAGSQDYYLGPEARVDTWTRVRPEDALFADGQRVVRVSVSHVGPPRPATVRAGGRDAWTGSIDAGHTTVLIPAAPRETSSTHVTVRLAGVETYSADLALAPVQARSIHLLPHSHVDIGYSDPQPEVERKQWKNLRDAVALAAETATLPLDARFKWNVEGLWSVESYLRQASEPEREAFRAAVRAGAIGVQANYTNVLTGLMTPDELRHWTDGATRLREEFGIEAGRSAMHSDIPGVSWTSVAALASAGVRYFSSGPNYMPGLPDGGDRIGDTLKALGDRPFWWTSPSGDERLLFWMAAHGYSWFHGLNTGSASDQGRDAILEYVRSLTASGYAYDMVQVRYTVGGDNGPVDRALPAFVASWNERFATPRLVIDTADAMFAEFERRHGAALPVRSGDMTPYWEDGAISTAAEEASVRAAVRRLSQAEALAALRQVPLPQAELASAWRSAILWHEHTWGAADSISQPDRPDVVAQWEYKRRFATDAVRQSEALLLAALQAPGAGSSVTVFNTLAWPRRGLVLLSAVLSRAGDRVLRDGTPVPSQRLVNGQLAVWLDEVPPFASVRLRIVAGRAQAPVRAATLSGRVLDNGRLRVSLDAGPGAIDSLKWVGAPDHDFSGGEPGIFRYLYVDGRDPGSAAGSSGGTLTIEDAGPLVVTARVDGPAGGTRSATRRFTMVAGSDQLFAELLLDKTPVRTKESGHVAFPLHVPDGVFRADLGEAVVEMERDQLPGSCRDFVGVQSALDVSGPGVGMSIVSLDAPLMELGALTDERIDNGRTRSWRPRVAAGTTSFAYLFNNYWHTNYKADQPGPMTFRFALSPHAAYDALALRRLSDEHDFPLVAAATADDATATPAPFSLEGDAVTLASLRASADGRTLVVRVYNPRPREARVTVRSTAPNGVVTEAAADATPKTVALTLTLPPRASRTVHVVRP